MIGTSASWAQCVTVAERKSLVESAARGPTGSLRRPRRSPIRDRSGRARFRCEPPPTSRPSESPSRGEIGARRICRPRQAPLETRRRLEPYGRYGITSPLVSARLLQVIDIAGTFVLAIQGASIAAVKGLDAFGIVVVSLATATGGGIMRDLLIGESPPEALRGWPIVTSALLGAFTTFFAFHLVEEIPESVLIVVDALGLALLAVSGTEKALEFRLTPIAAVMMGGDQRRWRIYDPGYPSRRSPGHSAGRLSRDGCGCRRDRPRRRPKRQGARQRRRPLGRRNMLRPENCRGLAALASADSEPALRQQSSEPILARAPYG